MKIRRVSDLDLSKLSYDTLIARQEVSLAQARVMMWMAKHYKSLGLKDGMTYCAERGILCVKEYQRVTAFLDQDKTAELDMAA
jgi:hypothetical protein